MKKTYLLSVIVASVLFAADSGVSSKMINPKPIDINVTNIQAESEAIVILKKGADFNVIDKLFATSQGYSKKEYSVIHAMHIKVPGKNFAQIKDMIEKIPMFSNSVEKIEPNIAFKPVEASNDSYYSKLWAVENTGQSVNNKSGTNDADMDVKEAWDIQKGSSDVVVAVVDTGVDYTHSDLADNMWSGNANHGYDFAGDDDGNNDSDPMPDTPYDDNGHYHGTHVAGTIGAVGDNNSGVSGVAQSVQIMALKVFRPNGYGYSSDILEAMDYIAQKKDDGVNIVAVNASYGGGGSQGDSMDKAIQKLGDKGIVFCAAAGNDSKNIDNDPVYPASYDATNIITIAASDQDDKLASFSNYGKNTVEVAAPGTNILSTYPDNQYAYLQGTSMATPNVTGVVALLSSENPSLTVSEKIKAVVESVDTKSDLTNKVSSNGRVNANSALKSVASESNHNPEANDDSATTEYETKVTIDVLSNDNDADGDSLTIKSTTTPSHGKADIKDGKIDYTPDNEYSGDDSFSYTISDGNGGSSSAKVSVTVKEKPNSAPIAKDDSSTTNEDEKVVIDVLSNDSDADGDSLSITIKTKPTNGVAEVKDGKVEYTPKANYNGDDSFTYTINDGNGGESSAKVTIKVNAVNDAPVVKDDIATTDEDNKVLIDVLDNDSDIDGDTLTIKSTTKPSHGSVKIVNSKIEYTPDSNYNGDDSFSYTVDDGNGATKDAKVTIKVNSVNDEPVAKDDDAKTDEDKKVVIGVLANDSDIDGDSLAIKIDNKPTNGVAVVKDGKVEYTPNANYNGKDSFTYIVDDGNGAQSSAKVTIDIKAVNDAPIAKDDSATTNYETKVTIDVLKNDSDIDSDALSIKSVTTPSHGEVEIIDGKVDYTPNSNYSGEDSFKYTVTDSNGATATAEVKVKVNSKEQTPPDAKDDSSTLKEDSSITIDVLANDSDEDGDSLSIKSVTNPTNGVAEIKNNKVIYTPNKDYNGKDSFSYTVTDGNGGESSAKVSLTIEAVNDKPIAKDDTTKTKENTSVKIDVLANDSDIDGDSLTIKIKTNPKHGDAKVVDGKVEYSPNENYNGNDSFTYTISDGNGGESSANVIIDVEKVNSAPIAKDDNIATNEDNKVVIDVLANDSDADGDALTINIESKPSNGVAVVKDGKVEYTPNKNYNGKDSFTYTIKDGNGAKSSAKVMVDVKPVNDNPIAKDDSARTTKSKKVVIDVLSNDSDADGDSLTIKSATKPKHGEAKIANNKIEYTPESGYLGEDKFSYAVKDSYGATNSATVTVNIDNEEPITKIEPIEKIIHFFKGLMGSKAVSDNEYLFDDDKGDIKIDTEKEEIELKHKLAPMPKEPIGGIKEFKLDGSNLNITFKMNKNLKF